MHDKLTYQCSEHVTAAPGGAVGEIDWSLYTTELEPAEVAAWYKARLGAALVADKGSWTASLPDTAAPVHVLDISAPGAGPQCGTLPAGTRAVVRLSTAVRR